MSTIMDFSASTIAYVEPIQPNCFKTRLRTAMKKEGVFTPADLARRLKVKPQTAHKWWSGQTKRIGAADLFKICDSLKVSARWLLFGKGSMSQYIHISPEEREILDLFNAMPDDWREDWVSSGRRTLDRLTTKPSQMVPYPHRK